jgi:hypothetical protein
LAVELAKLKACNTATNSNEHMLADRQTQWRHQVKGRTQMGNRDMDAPEHEPNIATDLQPFAFLVPEVAFEFPGKYDR